jgi:superfamily I DNA and/or RNA helicase
MSNDWAEQYSLDPEKVINWISGAYMMSEGDWADCIRRIAKNRDERILYLIEEIKKLKIDIATHIAICAEQASKIAQLEKNISKNSWVIENLRYELESLRYLRDSRSW